MSNWTKIILNKDLPEEGMPVLGYSKEWIDEDFNPNGIRECHYSGLNIQSAEWISAKWYDYQDCWETDEDTKPTHWHPIVEPPKE